MKKILLLLVALFAATTVWAGNYVTDVMVIGGSKSETNDLKTYYSSQGWTVVDQDLNAGCGSGSDYIFLLYKTAGETDPDATFITNFLISTATTPPNSFINNGRNYYLVSCDGSDYFKDNQGDLNSHCGSNSAYIHLYYTKDYSGEDYSTVKSISFSDTQVGGVPVAGGSTGYDLNTGCGSNSAYIYMHTDKSQGWTISKNSSGTQCNITGFDGPKSNIRTVTIPTEIDGAQVINFSGNVFSGFANLESMVFYDNTAVSQMPSLQGCSTFKHVRTGSLIDQTPPSMTIISESAFSGTAIENITLTSVATVGNYAFSGCGSLGTVNANSALQTIGAQAFSNCGSMSHLWFDGTDAQWNAVSKGSQWRSGSNFLEHWHCTVTFDTNGRGTAPAAQAIQWSNYDKATEPAAPSANCSVFLGWYTEAACTHQWNFNTVVPGDMTLYAKWDAQYTFDSATGALTLHKGEFNSNHKWSSDVPATAVTSVTATSAVSFTGDCSRLFYGFTNCRSMDLNNVNTDGMTNVQYMFNNCKNLTSLNLSNWHTAQVTDMKFMFSNCESLTSLNLSGWNTAQVTTMASMFYRCLSLSTLNLSGWNTENVTTMSSMFNACSSLTSLDLSGWNTAKVTTMDYLFYKCSSLTSLDLSGWNTAQVTDMSNMFSNCSSLTSLNLSGWNTAQVTTMAYMFDKCSSLTSLDLSGWNTAQVGNMYFMFYNCGNLTTIYASTSWSTANVTSSSAMFNNCLKLVGGKGTRYDLSHADAAYARIDRGTEQPGYLTGMFKLILPEGVTALPAPTNTQGNVGLYLEGTTVSLSYSGAMPEGTRPVYSVNGTEITGSTFEMPLDDATITIDFKRFYTFDSETGVLALLWGEFNSANKWGSDVVASVVTSVTATSAVSFTGDCRGLFEGFVHCGSMDLRGVNTAHMMSTDRMFADCPSLTAIYADTTWTTESVTSSVGMFVGCTALAGGIGTPFDANHTDAEYARIDRGAEQPGYLTAVFTITLPQYVTATPAPTFTQGDMSLYAAGTSITLSYSGEVPEGIPDIYRVNDIPIAGDTFVMPFEDVVVTIHFNHYTFDNGTGALALLWGVFNKYSKWGSDVPAEAVTSVTATSAVSFTGDCSGLFEGFTHCRIMDLNNVNTDNLTDAESMFSHCSSLTSPNLSGWNTAKVTNMNSMFDSCDSLTTLNLSGWNTAQVMSMNKMFNGCSSLSSLNLLGWNTAQVCDMTAMFSNCDSLTTLNLSGWDTAQVEDMCNMFNSCLSLNTLNLSGWNTAYVQNMSNMISGCPHLFTIYAGSGWSTERVTESMQMFAGSVALVGGKGTRYNDEHLDAEYARIDRGAERPGYFTDSSAIVPGDVNIDGKVDVSDVNIIINIMLGKTQPTNVIGNADLNGDNSIDVSDLNAVINIMLGKE